MKRKIDILHMKIILKAVFVILALLINIFICVLQFWNINSYAGMLLLPYLFWVAFGKVNLRLLFSVAILVVF